ncbi:MAG: hypothetical protein ABI280_12795, partial [Ginsengibacter sp.]
MQKNTMRYWFCQLFGWGGWTLLNLSFFYIFLQDVYYKGRRRDLFFAMLVIQLFWYIAATHSLRFFLKKTGWIKFSTKKVIGLFIIGVSVTGLLAYYGSKATSVVTGTSIAEYDKNRNLNQAIASEKSLGLADTHYYLADKNNPKDSLNYASLTSIRNNTGWYRNNTGEWKYEDQHRGRFWWDIIFTFILIALWLLLYMVWHYLERNRKDELNRVNLEKTVK